MRETKTKKPRKRLTLYALRLYASDVQAADELKLKLRFLIRDYVSALIKRERRLALLEGRITQSEPIRTRKKKSWTITPHQN